MKLTPSVFLRRLKYSSERYFEIKTIIGKSFAKGNAINKIGYKKATKNPLGLNIFCSLSLMKRRSIKGLTRFKIQDSIIMCGGKVI